MPCGTKTEGGIEYRKGERVFTNSNGTYLSGEAGIEMPNGTFKSTTGTCIPGFMKMKKSGALLPHTSFVQSTLEYSCKSTVSTHSESLDGNYWSSLNGNHWSGSVPLPSLKSYDAEELLDECEYFVQSAAASLYAQHFNALTFIAELRDIRRLWTSIGNIMSSRLMNIRFRDVGDAWLSWRYGLRPLIGEMQSLQAAIEDLDKHRKIESKRTGTTDSNSSTTSGSSNTNWNYSWEEKVTEVISYRGAVSAAIEAAHFRANLVETAWELVPYSFVIDWFVDVGQAIQAISFAVLSTQSTASAGFHAQRKVELTADGMDNDPNYNVSGTSPHVGTLIQTLTMRDPRSISKLPLMRIRLDPFKTADLVALIYQAYDHATSRKR